MSALNVLSIIISSIAMLTFLITLFKIATQLGSVLERLKNTTDNVDSVRQQLATITQCLTSHNVDIATHNLQIKELYNICSEIKDTIKEIKQE